MKKMMIGILIFQLMVNPTNIKELLKLPSLLEHFYHHNNHRSHEVEHHHSSDLESLMEMNFMSFYDTHYGLTAIKHTDNSHDKLPFKNSTNNRTEQQSIQLFVFEPNQIDFRYYGENDLHQPIVYTSFLKSNYLQNIWQPPKIS